MFKADIKSFDVSNISEKYSYGYNFQIFGLIFVILGIFPNESVQYFWVLYKRKNA